MGENELVVAEKSLVPMTITDVLERTALVRQVLEDVMIKDVHYGVIPGCGDKPTLLKPGAEKLCLTFRMAPEYVIEKIDLPKEHREYETTCNLYSIPGHAFIGSGVATCSTMETKYRYRNKPAVCPKCKAEAIIKGKKEYGGGWICWAKREGCGAKFEDGDKSIENQDTGKVENDNLSDQYNTVKKISAKRALTAATIVATSASDVFAQDLEDLKSNNVAVEAEVEIKDAETTTEEDMGKDFDKALSKPEEKEEDTEPKDAGGPMPVCEVCHGPMWDNRKKRLEETEAYDNGERTKKPSPAFRCKKKGCDGVVWSYKEWLEGDANE